VTVTNVGSRAAGSPHTLETPAGESSSARARHRSAGAKAAEPRTRFF